MNIKSKACQKPPKVIFSANMGTFVRNYRFRLCGIVKVKVHGKDYLRTEKSAHHRSFEKFRKSYVFCIYNAFEPCFFKHRKISDYSEKQKSRGTEYPHRSKNHVFLYGHRCKHNLGRFFRFRNIIIVCVNVRVSVARVQKHRKFHLFFFVFYKFNDRSGSFFINANFRNVVKNA